MPTGPVVEVGVTWIMFTPRLVFYAKTSSGVITVANAMRNRMVTAIIFLFNPVGTP